MNFSKEMGEKAKEAKSPEELITIANDNGFDLTEEEADEYYGALIQNQAKSETTNWAM